MHLRTFKLLNKENEIKMKKKKTKTDIFINSNGSICFIRYQFVPLALSFSNTLFKQVHGSYVIICILYK